MATNYNVTYQSTGLALLTAATGFAIDLKRAFYLAQMTQALLYMNAGSNWIEGYKQIILAIAQPSSVVQMQRSGTNWATSSSTAGTATVVDFLMLNAACGYAVVDPVTNAVTITGATEEAGTAQGTVVRQYKTFLTLDDYTGTNISGATSTDLSYTPSGGFLATINSTVGMYWIGQSVSDGVATYPAAGPRLGTGGEVIALNSGGGVYNPVVIGAVPLYAQSDINSIASQIAFNPSGTAVCFIGTSITDAFEEYMQGIFDTAASGHFTVGKFGKSGSTIVQHQRGNASGFYTAFAAWLTARQAEGKRLVIHIELGTNDNLGGAAAASTSLDTLIAQLREDFPNAIIMLMPPIYRASGGSGAGNSTTKLVLDIQNMIVTKNTTLMASYPGKHFRANEGGFRFFAKYLEQLTDAIHPNATYSEIWARQGAHTIMNVIATLDNTAFRSFRRTSIGRSLIASSGVG